MITNETLAQINEKLEEIFKICEANKLPMIAMVYCEEINDSTIFSGGTGKDQSLMVGEIIANLVEDMKSDVSNNDKVTRRQLLGLLMGEVADHLEVYLSKEDSDKPEMSQVMSMLGNRIESDIDVELNKIFTGKNPSPEAVLEAKMAISKVLTQYSLNEKVDFTVDIVANGEVEVSFFSIKETEGMH